jgi:cytochrome P450
VAELIDLADVPHPPGRLPVLGDVVGLDRSTPVQSAMATARELGPIFQRKVLNRRFTIVGGADLAADLVDDARFEKFLTPAVRNLRKVAGDGLFTAFSNEPSWTAAHDLLRPAFSQAAMRSYHATMLDVAHELIECWDAAGGQPVDVSADMTKVTLETIGRTGFSYSFESFSSDTTHPFVTAMIDALQYAFRTVIRPPVIGDLLYREADRKHAADLRYVLGLIEDIIAARQASADPRQDDLLGLMLAGSDEAAALDPVNVRNQVITFLVAGHETTSGALSFALYYLATNPEAFARARAEVDEVWGAEGDPSFEQVAKLRYVRRVLDESLRLWPTAPGFARVAKQDTVIGGRYRMRAGEWALVLLPAVHRDPAVWGPHPERFDPDRFLPENVRARPGHAYKPFGTGERACIGRQFAIHEAVLMLGLLLRRYDFAADPGYALRVTERLTMMPDGFRLNPSLRAGVGAAPEAGVRA